MPADELDAVDGGTVTFVNKFHVHASSEAFERAFAETSAFMAEQDGFVRHTLLLHTDDAHTYLNIAQWRDAGAFRAAVAHADFRPHAAALRALSTSEPGLYEPLWSRDAPGGAGRDVVSADPAAGRRDRS
ncbi:antibiotic biosynthesis monooxygenase family protein [Streptomyces sp. NPDC020801]|uniref:antibiotic biosynthesis monooxygenase family protein n=1 Tax=unclassified Streptomyces TaxID=2593676 RepID=UPI003788722F